MKRAAFLLPFLTLALALVPPEGPQNLPWDSGERLVYALSWKGLRVGRQILEARKIGSGWRFTGKVVNSGLTNLVGFEMSVTSYTRPALFTRRFQRILTVPGEGKRVLTAVVGKETSVSFLWVNGKVYTYSRPQTDVLDDASVLYYVRVHPDRAKLWFINYPDLVSAPLKSLGRRTLRTAFGRRDADGYLFDAEGARIEVWYGATAQRLPLRIFFGLKWGGFTAELIKVEHTR